MYKHHFNWTSIEHINNLSVMLGRSHRFLGITSTLRGKYVLLKDTARRNECESNRRPLDPESEVLIIRPACPLRDKLVVYMMSIG